MTAVRPGQKTTLADLLRLNGFLANLASLLAPWLVGRLLFGASWSCVIWIGFGLALLGAAGMIEALVIDQRGQGGFAWRLSGVQWLKTIGGVLVILAVMIGPAVGMITAILTHVWWIGELIAGVLFVGGFVAAFIRGPGPQD